MSLHEDFQTPGPVDQAQRLEAIDPTQSICVTAPAGSGKTELLSQRVLGLLSRVEQPEEILAITFTRKAAAEMHQRIMEALYSARDQGQPEQPHKLLSWTLARQALERDQACGWQLLENPNRLKVQTIDSLCASLTRQMPILSQFGAQPKISDDASELYRAATHSFLKRLEGEGVVSDDLAALFELIENDFNKLERLLVTMLQRRDQWLLHIGLGASPDQARRLIEATLEQVVTDRLQALHSELLSYAPELLPLFDYAGCNIQWLGGDSPVGALAGIIELPVASVSALPQWLGITELLLKKDGEFRKTVNKQTGFPTETEDGDKGLAKELKSRFLELLGDLTGFSGLHEALLEIRHLPAPCFADEQWALMESLSRLLPALVAELTVVFQQYGEVDHTQVSLAALDALGDAGAPTELAMKLDYRLRHILIDEFQDTSSTQYRLLERLVEGWSEQNASNPQSPNTLFLVGDGMQSIYGFREANVGLFLEAKRKGVNGIRLKDLHLSVNFRSAPSLVDWFNLSFPSAFPAEENLSRGAVPFELADAFNAPSEHSEISVHGFSGDYASTNEAAHVVTLVRKSLETDPDGSVAILVRSRAHLQDIVAALAAEGIPWNATDIDPLASNSPVVDLLSLTKAMHDISDRVSWTALLRSPWIGLSTDDLYRLVSAGGDNPILFSLADPSILETLSPFAQQRLAEVAPVLAYSYQQRNRLSARSWIEGLWIAVGGAACLKGEHELSMVEDYFSLLESLQKGDSLVSLSQLEQSVSRLYAAPANPDARLQLMTIHKSKGLEFDTVILPGLARPPRSDDRSLLMWREYLPATGKGGLIISPLPASGVEDATYKHLRHEKQQATLLENTRLLYVAATRAVKSLHLTFSTTINEKTGDPKAPAAMSLMRPIWSALDEQIQWHHDSAVEEGQIGLSFDDGSNRSLDRLKAGWQRPDWNFPNPLAEFEMEADYGDQVNLPEINADPTPSQVGTVVHAVLETLVGRGLDHWRGQNEEQQRNWLSRLLQHQGVAPPQLDSSVQRVKLAIDNTVMDSKGRWLLGDSGLVSATELPLMSSRDGRLRQRIVDRVVDDEQGNVWVVDYKTAAPNEGESRQAFIQRECGLYRDQLMDYKWHIEQLVGPGKSVKVALYFTSIPLFQEVS